MHLNGDTKQPKLAAIEDFKRRCETLRLPFRQVCIRAGADYSYFKRWEQYLAGRDGGVSPTDRSWYTHTDRVAETLAALEAETHEALTEQLARNAQAEAAP